MHVSMYFLHLMLTFTPHYIIMVKGLHCMTILPLIPYIYLSSCDIHVHKAVFLPCAAAILGPRTLSLVVLSARHFLLGGGAAADCPLAIST